ncbi:polymerase [Leman virus]|uniref:Replicase n=1 Tax=Leman virus TaxID=3071226 RepID=A0AAE7CAG9_9RHAB|nr:polymerase [Perhabdovirus perca]QIQ19249.1 polymerase [Leman virus]
MSESDNWEDPHWGDSVNDADIPEWLSDDITRGYPLNQKDYSLNSPLISDATMALVRYLNDRITEKRFERSEKVFLGLSNLTKNNTWKDPEKYNHKWMGTWFNKDETCIEFNQLLDETNKDVIETEEVLQAFLKGWIGQTTNAPTKTGWSRRQRSYGSKFFKLHKMILLMNAQSEEEQIILQSTLNLTVVDKELRIYKGTSDNIGNYFLTPEFLLLLDQEVIFDRTFILMMKDTLIGRMQTLACFMNREDQKYENDIIPKMETLYRLGDRMIESIGDDAYAGIKLLEPMCNLRLAEIARTYRPLVPEFPHFRHHVEASVAEESLNNRNLTDFYEFVNAEANVETLLAFFGSFRHWGHPYIDYFEGLKKLNKQVTLPKEIDNEYAEALASDLSYMILRKHFNTKRVWAVNKELLNPNHPLIDHIKNATWPTPKQIDDFGDKWHQLPLVKIFDIPDLIDPSVIYSDKSHSMGRSEVLEHVEKHPHQPIPTRKVLETLLKKPATNWPEFLSKIETEGLPTDSLVIGLKGKERELKKAGRFFSLMSWELREYFVITEHLIKTHYVPLFKGLTMADDMTEVVKKMLERSQGQGEDDYEHISIANHIDYEKWNNHQRKASNGPVFRVMGQFLGYPSLIEKTHDFFQQSLIYYNGRPDLMEVRGEELQNKTEKLVCWDGQDGGLEGLRQKGWSILNLLVIQRESKIRNTKVQTLAQGDNQVVCTQYRVMPTRATEELVAELEKIKVNNQVIMDAIEVGTNKLGLLINNDETIQSADFLTYGKVPIFRGNIRCLETKRWSRVTCVTNDQLPSLANVMSSVSTNSLTVSHFDVSPVESMRQYLYFGNFARKLVEFHNPAIRGPVKLDMEDGQKKIYLNAILYLDPSLGGVSGMSLTRFLMRMFPDPVTEGLSFWKIIFDNTSDKSIQKLSLLAGDPELARKRDSIDKLIENPAALNLSKETSALSVIKKEVRSRLYQDCDKFENRLIADAIGIARDEENHLEQFLLSIRPLFPRFLAEFKAATFVGITESLISLFQNSKTIRNIFKRKYARELELKIVRCEWNSLLMLKNLGERPPRRDLWKCSASRADELRHESWGTKVIGTTVPHPIEMINCSHTGGSCKQDEVLDYINVSIVQDLKDCLTSKGKVPAYLGSKTSETTSILQPWEKETKIPVIKRAAKLRSAITWFVDPDSDLSNSILNNIESLTGEDWSGSIQGFKRTGSALHRFTSARVSAGGFSAQSPARLTRMMATTDTFREIGSDNYDFMFQSLLLYSQMTAGELYQKQPTTVYHFHMSCSSCLRKIEEPILNSDFEYKPIDRSNILNQWKPTTAGWSQEKVAPLIQEGNWDEISHQEQSFQVGKSIGFLFGDLTMIKNNHAQDSSIFPLSIQHKITPSEFLEGLLDGLIKASALSTIHRRNFDHHSKYKATVSGTVDYLIERISESAGFTNLTRNGPLQKCLLSVPHKIPPSYPLSRSDLGALARNYLRALYAQSTRSQYKTRWNDNWIFSDMMSSNIIYPFVVSVSCVGLAYGKQWDQKSADRLRGIRGVAEMIRSSDEVHLPVGKNFKTVNQEIRHAIKYHSMADDAEETKSDDKWTKELTVPIRAQTVDFGRAPIKKNLSRPMQVRDPLISGLRTAQIATGAHYKIRAILTGLSIQPHDALCGGDGSGGIGACLIRTYPFLKLIYNSLFEIVDLDMRGSAPGPPSALSAMGCMKDRCINLNSAWKNPSDLSHEDTWEYFMRLMDEEHLRCDLWVFDMEVRSHDMSLEIEKHIAQNLDAMPTGGTLIYKTYLTKLADMEVTILDTLGGYFRKVSLVSTEATSSHSSEVYAVFQDKLNKRRLEIYPNWRSCETGMDIHPCWRSEKEEFQRATKFWSQNRDMGVPKRLKTNTFHEMHVLGVTSGVENGIAATLATDVELNQDDQTTVAFLWLFVTLQHMIPIGRGFKIPASSKVESYLAILIGFCSILHLQKGDVGRYQKLKTCFAKAGPFFCHMTGWNTKTGINKSVRMDRKMATIGSVIRTFSKLNLRNEVNFDKLRSMMSKYVSRDTIRNMKTKSGIWEYLDGAVVGEKTATNEWNPVDKEAAWRE